MTTPTTRRRTDAATSPAARSRSVEDMLHELAYVLHVTRKVSQPAVRPATAPRPTEPVQVSASA